MAKNDYIRDSIRDSIATCRAFMIFDCTLISSICGYGIIHLDDLKDIQIILGTITMLILAVCLIFLVGKSIDLHLELRSLEHE